MNPRKLPVFFALIAVLLHGAVSIVAAQEEDELETIELPDLYDKEPPAAQEDAIEGVVYDEEARQYRLIEDPEDENIVEPPSQREDDERELMRLFNSYKEAIQSGDYLEADTLAKRVIELSIKLYGIESHESAKALTNLGIAQHNNKEYDAAMRNFTASIDVIERLTDRLNADLINPLKGLGATQIANGRPDLARETFHRAVHVSHVNEGPHNHDQIELLESLAEIYLAVGEHKEALDIQENMFSIQARNLNPKGMEMIPALEKQARWQHRLQMYDRERISWRRIVRILEKEYGKEDLRLIPPLTSLGKSYLFITPAEYDFQPEVSVASGETYLRRANRIADRNPEADWQIVEQTLLSLGDYYVLSARPNRASKLYLEAWTLMSEDPERLDVRREHLEELNVLQHVYPPRYYRSEPIDEELPDPDEYETGTISFAYVIGTTGRVGKIEHIETLPPEFEDMRDRVRRNLKNLIYRPRVEDGEIVKTPDMVFTHEFYYKPDDIPRKTTSR